MKIKMVIRNLKYFIPILFKVNPFSVIFLVLSAIIDSILSLIWIVFPKLIIEELTLDQNVQTLTIIIVSFIISNMILRLISDFFNNLSYYFIDKADFVIDKMFNDKVANLDYFHIEDPEFADKLSYARQCLKQYSSGIYTVTWFFRSVISFIVTVSGVITIIFSSGEFLVVFIVLIGMIMNNLFIGKLNKIDQDFNEGCVRYNRLQWYFNNSMMAFRSQKNLRLYNCEEMIQKHSDEINDTIYTLRKDVRNKRNVLNIFENGFYYFITIFGIIILLAYSAYVSDSISKIATFTMLYSAVNTFDSEMSGIIYTIKNYVQECVYQENYINLMEIETVFKDGVDPIDRIETIEFKNVSFKYPRTEEYVLKDINFKISSKEKISLVGLNGSGKTTMIKLLCRFFEVEEGEILVNGVNINNYNYKEYMRKLAVVFQDFKIISFNIKNNITIDEYDEERFKDVLKRAEVLDKVESLPEKENTYINKWFDNRGVEFSGGEMQKFALARALYKNADLVILDEPTSALDPMAEANIYYHFNEVVGKKLTIFISHRLSSCIFSDRILVLDGSRIVESGTHNELMSNEDGLYYKMFNSQAEFYKD